jgi:restriction endonuclease S subunit
LNSAIQRKRLGDLFVFKNGRAFKKEEWSTTGLPIIRIQNLNNDQAPFHRFAGEYSQDILVEPGDLLFSWSGTVGSSFGSHIWSGERGVLNQHIFKVGSKEAIAKRYAFYGLRRITEAIEQSVNGAVGLVHITKEKLNEFTLPIPPLPAQERIADILDEALAAIATARTNTKRNLRNARELFESHLNAGFSQPGEGWIEERIGDIATFTSGLWKGEKPPFVQVGVIRNTNFTKDGLLDDTDIAVLDVEVAQFERRRLQLGDIILEKSGGGPRQAVGRVVLFDKTTGTFSFSNFTLAIRIKDPSTLDAKYLHLYLYWLYLSGATEAMQTHSTGIRNLNTEAYKATRVPYPSREEQERLAAILGQLFSETKRLNALVNLKLLALDDLEQSLLNRAFPGPP